MSSETESGRDKAHQATCPSCGAVLGSPSENGVGDRKAPQTVIELLEQAIKRSEKGGPVSRETVDYFLHHLVALRRFLPQGILPSAVDRVVLNNYVEARRQTTKPKRIVRELCVLAMLGDQLPDPDLLKRRIKLLDLEQQIQDLRDEDDDEDENQEDSEAPAKLADSAGSP